MFELSHDVLAPPRTLAQTATRRDGLLQDGAHGHVDGAEEQVNVLAAIDLDQRHELHQLHAHLVLFLVAQQVRHCRLVVPLPSTDLHRDRFAASVLAQETFVGVRVLVVVRVGDTVQEVILVGDKAGGVAERVQGAAEQEGEKCSTDRVGHFTIRSTAATYEWRRSGNSNPTHFIFHKHI